MFRIFGVIVVFVWAMAGFVYADCHNSEQCEDLIGDNIVNEYWDKEYNNTVHYKINTGYNPQYQISLSGDIPNASNKWHNLLYKGVRIPFNPTRQSPDTTKIAGTQDDTNVVSWKSGLPWATLAQAYQWHVSGTNNKEFAEVDIGFNYQRTFTYHANLGQFPNAYCLLAVATHEFGHFAGLGDAKAQHNCPTQYIRYTMWANQAVGTGGCPVESLECEDKWALWYTYTVIHPDADD